VVSPPNNPATAPDNGPPNPGNSAAAAAGNGFAPPTDSDGRPAKVFVLITPKTTDAYVGEIIPMRIEFYIRNDVDYPQNSLPTIDGSDFLMNDLSVRPQEDGVVLMNEGYRRESWFTAIEAPRSGDFPLQMERDTYWQKAVQNNFSGDPFARFFGPRPVLAHNNISSNHLVVHVHSLPEEGRPANFTGAIGQFKVTPNVSSTSVNVGDPVTLHFVVTGQGNFSYIQCPVLAPDPNWKTYTSTSKVVFDDESHTKGTKTFEQAVIPKKNGQLPLPAASFSYFDPDTKQYVSSAISLPDIDVTGTAQLAATAAPGAAPDNSTASPAPAATEAANFLPNRLDVGTPQASLAPVYQAPWFWAAQGGLVALLLLGVARSIFRSTSEDEETRAERSRRRLSLHQEEDAMSEAVRNGDATTFFLAARHAVQLQLGTQWRLQPEAITLAEIRKHQPEMAESLEPLFAQTDEIIYSGGAVTNLDLAQWEIHVRGTLQQLQPA
jgi:hypothetical protein